jgi:hypothetical protein
LILSIEEGVGQGIDNYRDMRRQVHSGQGAVELPEDGGIAKEQGEYAGFILPVDTHIDTIARKGEKRKGTQDSCIGFFGQDRKNISSPGPA